MTHAERGYQFVIGGAARLALFVVVAAMAAAWALRRLRPWEWRVTRTA